jgi:hypothetical protein
MHHQTKFFARRTNALVIIVDLPTEKLTDGAVLINAAAALSRAMIILKITIVAASVAFGTSYRLLKRLIASCGQLAFRLQITRRLKQAPTFTSKTQKTHDTVRIATKVCRITFIHIVRFTTG